MLTLFVEKFTATQKNALPPSLIEMWGLIDPTLSMDVFTDIIDVRYQSCPAFDLYVMLTKIFSANCESLCDFPQTWYIETAMGAPKC